MTGRPPFVLASASPRRLDLLARLGVVPDVVDPAAIDETPDGHELPRLHVVRLAREKALAVSARHPQSCVLAGDTIVAVGRRILPKADDEATARACLTLLSGRRHTVATAVAVVASGRLHARLSVTTVGVAPLSPADRDAYLASDEWRGKAGGYAIQGRFEAHVRFLQGSHSGVVGLPLFETRALLRTAGVLG